MGLEDAEDLATSDALDERDTVLVTEQDANLRRHLALLRSLGNHLVHLPFHIVRARQSTNRIAQIEPLRNEGGKQITSVAAILSQVGGVLLYGSADDEIPFLRHRDTHTPLEHTEFTREQH